MPDPLERVPTPAEFQGAFEALDPLPDSYRRLLCCHYAAPNRDVTATELSQLVGYRNYNAANLHYGTLARWVAEYVHVHPAMALDLLVTMEKQEEWHWCLRPEVAAALEQLGWPSAA